MTFIFAGSSQRIANCFRLRFSDDDVKDDVVEEMSLTSRSKLPTSSPKTPKRIKGVEDLSRRSNASFNNDDEDVADDDDEDDDDDDDDDGASKSEVSVRIKRILAVLRRDSKLV